MIIKFCVWNNNKKKKSTKKYWENQPRNTELAVQLWYLIRMKISLPPISPQSKPETVHCSVTFVHTDRCWRQIHPPSYTLCILLRDHFKEL